MASLGMTLLDLLNKSEQGADPNFLRDGVQLLAQELMDAEVTDLVGGRATPAHGRSDHLPQRLSRPGVGHPRWHLRATDPKAPPGHLFPEPARATPPARAGAALGGAGGLHPRRLDKGGR
jgi:hypothetical protein